ncbi:MAG: chemotaxis protein CheW [Deltaproteobacteria bacterium]|nr:chemotaxis protein CheW [Deltaproteobacteria bacterium]
MSLSLFTGLNRQVPEQERKIVKFSVGSILCAVDIMHVREIILPREISPLPADDPSVIGVLDHREAAIPVVDLRRRFKVNDVRRVKQRWIIIAVEEKSIALVVDTVFGVITIHKNQRRDHSALGSTDVSWASDVFGDQDGLLFEIDLVMLANSVTAS